MRRAVAPGWLPLERAERVELSLTLEHPLHSLDTERADQLVFEILYAHIEAEPFHVFGCEIGPESGALESTLEVARLAGIAEARELQADSGRAETLQCTPDVLRPVDRDDGDALFVEAATSAAGERFERTLIAHTFDEHNRTRIHAVNATDLDLSFAFDLVHNST